MALTNTQGKLITLNDIGQLVQFNVSGNTLYTSGDTSFSTMPTTGLVSKWKLDESSFASGAILDTAFYLAGTGSNPANNGTRFGTSPVITTGKIGNAHTFSGDDYIKIPFNPNLNSTSASVALWTYFPTGFTSGKTFFARSSAGGVVALNFVTRSGKFTFGSANTAGTNQELQATNAIPVDTWVHFVVTHDGSTKKIYINGVLDTSVAQSGLYATSVGDLGFGGHIPDPSDRGTVNMDEVLWYNTALSAGQVTSLYQSYFTSVTLSGLVGWWPFINDTNDIALAVGGTAANNPAKNAALNGSASINNGLVLPGGDSDFAKALALPAVSSFSLEAWIKPSSFPHNEAWMFREEFVQFMSVFSSPSGAIVFGTNPLCNDTGYGSGSQLQGLAGDILTTAYNHVVLTFTGGNRKIYINGGLRYQDSGVSVCSTTTPNLWFGGYPYAGGNGAVGTMRDARFYNIALSITQVRQNFNAGMSNY